MRGIDINSQLELTSSLYFEIEWDTLGGSFKLLPSDSDTQIVLRAMDIRFCGKLADFSIYEKCQLV